MNGILHAVLFLYCCRNEMIGCMSFLVGDLIGPNKVSLIRNSIFIILIPYHLHYSLCLSLSLPQQVNGWYQLLDEGRGLAENVPVPNSLVSMGSQSSLSSTVSAPPSITKCYAVRNSNTIILCLML